MFLNDLQNRLQPSAIPKEQNLQKGEVIPSDIISHNQSNCQEPLETGKLF
ncbi:hypothetical protein ALC60_12468 [Trachymyrmex zeteki]|uniref:Uncharacterized protein n=1 Tax=Mycetomoellerius zeteki TaxID=64791 RepID=A0A151WL01_9HYME|nr:hypothetical protein ALC60_12468 [Trachymyrmex zeteki]